MPVEVVARFESQRAAVTATLRAFAARLAADASPAVAVFDIDDTLLAISARSTQGQLGDAYINDALFATAGPSPDTCCMSAWSTPRTR